MKKLTIIIIVLLTIPLLKSCNSQEINDDKLRGFMLAGIYFIDGYGGMDRVVEILTTEEGRTTDKQLIEGYKGLLEFPYEISQKASTQDYLKNFWKISNKTALLAEIDALKNVGEEYKAWDYARLVNITCNGYSAEYLSKDEVLTITQEVLSLVQKRYDTWDAYYTDYNLGLKNWDAQSKQVIDFGKVTKEILGHEKSIYKLLPLHSIKE